MFGILRRQLKPGAVADLDVAAQETAVAQATLHPLAVLTGHLQADPRDLALALDAPRAEYRSTVLVAFRNVADALRALEADAASLAAAIGSLVSLRGQLELGGASYLGLLDAEQAYAQVTAARAAARAARYADTAALFQALAGPVPDEAGRH
jgi:outer membrane protein TolC